MSDDPLLRGLEPPAVPSRLREDALTAARAAPAAAPRRDPGRGFPRAPPRASRGRVRRYAPRRERPSPAERVLATATSEAETRPDPELASIARLPHRRTRASRARRETARATVSRTLIFAASPSSSFSPPRSPGRWMALGRSPPGAAPPVAARPFRPAGASGPRSLSRDPRRRPRSFSAGRRPDSEKWSKPVPTDLDVFLAPLGDGPRTLRSGSRISQKQEGLEPRRRRRR